LQAIRCLHLGAADRRCVPREARDTHNEYIFESIRTCDNPKFARNDERTPMWDAINATQCLNEQIVEQGGSACPWPQLMIVQTVYSHIGIQLRPIGSAAQEVSRALQPFELHHAQQHALNARMRTQAASSFRWRTTLQRDVCVSSENKSGSNTSEKANPACSQPGQAAVQGNTSTSPGL
jgi:hypothetical protein